MIKRKFLRNLALTTLTLSVFSVAQAAEITLSTQTALPTKHALAQSYI